MGTFRNKQLSDLLKLGMHITRYTLFKHNCNRQIISYTPNSTLAHQARVRKAQGRGSDLFNSHMHQHARWTL